MAATIATAAAALALVATSAGADPVHSARQPAPAAQSAVAPADVHEACRAAGVLDFYATNVNVRYGPSTATGVVVVDQPGDCWNETEQVTGQAVWCPATGTYVDQWAGGIDSWGFGGYVNWCYLGVP